MGTKLSQCDMKIKEGSKKPDVGIMEGAFETHGIYHVFHSIVDKYY